MKPDGQSCEAWAMADSEFCYFHSPEISDKEKKATQSRGGQANKIKILKPLEPITLRKDRDVVLLFEDTINRVRAGEMDLKVANCIGFLAGHLIKVIETAKLEGKAETTEQINLTAVFQQVMDRLSDGARAEFRRAIAEIDKQAIEKRAIDIKNYRH